MSICLDEEICSSKVILGHTMREGFVFVRMFQSPPNIYDTILIETHIVKDCWFHSKKTLEEHIELINELKIEKAVIVSDNIDFIAKCPTLKHISISIPDDSNGVIDFSPLYQMSCIKTLFPPFCYGKRLDKEIKNKVDCSKLKGVETITIYPSCINFNTVTTFKNINVGCFKSENLETILPFDSETESFSASSCSFKSINGIERAKNMKKLDLSYNRSLNDISNLKYIKDSLTYLEIDSCAKIKDFSVLHELENLEQLYLLGSNKLPDLSFLKVMKNLKKFGFSMEVLDGDLTPCLELQHAYCLRGRKYYNLKDRDLPKMINSY